MLTKAVSLENPPASTLDCAKISETKQTCIWYVQRKEVRGVLCRNDLSTIRWGFSGYMKEVLASINFIWRSALIVGPSDLRNSCLCGSEGYTKPWGVHVPSQVRISLLLYATETSLAFFFVKFISITVTELMFQSISIAVTDFCGLGSAL